MKTPKLKFKKITNSKFGFSLWRNIENPRLWQVRLKTCDQYIRKRYYADNLIDAEQIALVELGFETKIHQEIPNLTLAEAFNYRKAKLQCNELGRKHWSHCVRQFLKWLANNHPNVKQWKLLTRLILVEYADYLSKTGLKNTTVLHYFKPIKMTSRAMHLDYDFKDIAAEIQARGEKQKPTPRVHLIDLLEFLEYLESVRPDLHLVAMLQGLVGLRVTEALRLQWSQIDLEQGAIEISGESKNISSQRVIPIVQPVIDALHKQLEGAGSSKGHVCISSKGNPWSNYAGYGRALRKHFRE